MASPTGIPASPDPALAAGIEFSLTDPHGDEAQGCLARYFSEIALRFEGGFDRAAGGAAAVEDYSPPMGAFLIARRSLVAVGCGAVRTFAPGIAEIKRMWVSPEARGLGLGRRLLHELEKCARNLKLHTVRLDTNETLNEAIRLYRAAGYREIGRFNDNPYAQRWFEKNLS